MDHDLIAELYEQMLLIRRFEEESARLYTERKVGGFLHLYIGQEAIAVGTASVLEEQDHVIATYRCHGHYLAGGGDPGAGFAELMGKVGGCAKGRGGSMHFYDLPNRFLGGWGIVGAHIPVAAGVAFAAKYRNDNSVTICFMGDGAINVGPFHEGLSLAALWKLPVIYVIENNHFAMGTPLHKTAASEDLSIRALAYPMARDSVDGHDVFAVRASIHSALRRAREESLPTLIEANTYRYRGHSMADPAKYRSKDDLAAWKARDPIKVLGMKMKDLHLQERLEQIDQNVETRIQDALRFAEESPEPQPESALNYVYQP